MTAVREARRYPLALKLALSLISVLAFLALSEGILALMGVETDASVEDPYVGFAAYSPLYVPDGDSGYLVTAESKTAWFNRERFPKRKPEGTTRIFCLGGSTTYGRPFEGDTSFSGWLREYLAAACPTRKFEVINAGGISYASYRVAVLMEELSEYEPDIFVVYSGHNEALEKRTYADLTAISPLLLAGGSILGRTRVYSAIRQLAQSEADSDESSGERYQLGEEVRSRLDQSFGPEDYTRDDELMANIGRHYRFNLERMVLQARSAEARILFVTPAANLKDCSPFKSEHGPGLSAKQIARFEESYARGLNFAANDNHDAARKELEAALALDDRFAGAHYALGRSLLALGLEAEAQRSFERAIDEDICPLRAVSSWKRTLREVVQAVDVPLVDFESLLSDASRASSGQNIPGLDLFLDHVHPSIEGHRLLARALLDRFESEGWLAIDPGFDGSDEELLRERIEGRLDGNARNKALLNLAKVMGWAGRFEEARGLAEEVSANSPKSDPSHGEALFLLGTFAEQESDSEKAHDFYLRATQGPAAFHNANYNLAISHIRRGEASEAVARLQEFTAVTKDYAPAYLNLGNALRGLGQLEEAIVELQRALALEPQNAVILNSLGAARLQAGDVQTAISILEQSVQIEAANDKALFNLGLALAANKDWSKALNALEQCLELRPNDPKVHRYLAICLKELGQMERAQSHLDQSAQLQESSELSR